MRRLRFALACAALMAGALFAPAEAATPAAPLEAQDYIAGAWPFYASHFLDASGRVLDNANGNISHSEGQGSGMLLAVAADDRSAFDRIWNWTRRNLMVEDVGLAAWKWDPNSEPHVADTNNATDGDLLMAWALLRAYRRWGDADYFDAARSIATAIGEYDVVEQNGQTLLLPGAMGFDSGDANDAVILNLSYWVFPAINELRIFAPDFPAKELIATGLSLLSKAEFGPSKLPADWVQLKNGKLEAAPDFAFRFGYDAIRIPLYLAWYLPKPADRLAPYTQAWFAGGQPMLNVIGLPDGKPIQAFGDPGYLGIAELVRCSTGGRPLATAAHAFRPTQYYPSTLDMLSLLATIERYPRCSTGAS